MSSSAGTPGPPSNAPAQGDSKAPPAPTNSSPDTGNSSPPANSGSGNNNSNNDNKNNNYNGSGDASNKNNNSNSPSESSSSPPPASPPPSRSSPLPASPPPSKEGGSRNSPPSENSPPPKASPPPSSPPPSKSSSPPPSSPPPSSSSPSEPSTPVSSPPPNSSGQSSPPPAPGQSSPPPSPVQSSPPPAPGQSSSASNQPATNGNPDSGGPKWSPPSQPDSPPSPASSTPGGTSPQNSNTQANPPFNVLSPPTDSKSSPSRESPRDSSPASNSLSGEKTRSTSSGRSSPSIAESADSGTIIGAAVAGVFVVALIAIFFVMRGRRKKRDAYSSHYMPPSNNYNEKTDGYYYGQNYPMKYSGPVDNYYASQTQPGTLTNSYGSPRANGYHGGGGGSDSDVIGGSKSFFTYEEVMEITNGFSLENVIGEGGFGCVYKGSLPDGRVVAVKQLKAGSGQGEREFRAEVEIISRVHHRHLVSLVGYCISENNRLLIYEFVPNNNLEHHLHGKGMPVLDWSKRVKVAVGSAKGLAYLHEDCHPKIIHRDIKSANILIDNDFEAQVADFGLAKLNDTTQTHVSTRVMGTFGYLAPEYASSGKLTDRSDVFSFGVVLLELITGRKPVDASQPLGDESLVEWARPHLVHALETRDISELVDPRLEKHYVESEMLRMIEAAAACVRHSAPKRPRMVQVMRTLDSEGEMSDLSNGVKYGQSTIYDSGQYNQDIMMFRKMALGFEDSSELSGEYTSRDVSCQYSGPVRSQETLSEFTSVESETRAINQNSSQQRYSGSQGCSGRRF